MRTINIDTISGALAESERDRRAIWNELRVSGSVPVEILIYLDFFFFFFALFAVDAASVRASIFSRSRLFSFPFARLFSTRSHVNRQTRYDEDERIRASLSFHFETNLRVLLLLLLLRLASSGQITTFTSQTERFLARRNVRLSSIFWKR